MIDLSTITIPPADVVPDPTAENLEAFAAFCAEANSGTDEFMVESLRDRWPATAIYFARRCRELEARLNQIADASGFDGEPDCPPIIKLLNTFENTCEELSVRNKELEAEVERLKQMMAWTKRDVT